MWIVRLALRRPYTFVVMALMIMLLGVVTIFRTPTDIFPAIDIPVVSVIWSYNGLPPNEMEGRIVTICERAMTTTVNDIEHIESQSLTGVSVIRVYFQPNVKIEQAVAQVTAINQTLLRIVPPGTTPPLIVQYSASNVPILQAALQSDTLSEQELYDLGTQFLRTQLATVQGAQVPTPFGGKQKQVQVDLDPGALYANGLAPGYISIAINNQSVILPSGTARIGKKEYFVKTNSSPLKVDTLNDMPVKQVGGPDGATVFVRDVATVHSGFPPQTSMVHADGKRSALLTILKSGQASTLDVVERIKAALPRIQSTLPPELNVKLLFDQSVFVKATINGVLIEAAVAATLTALMILLFLGSWRSTLIIATSIPLSIMCSIIIFAMLGETLNVMTLGGLALAVGILVDDATVEIENIHRNLHMGKPIVRAILDGAQQIAVPAFVATLAICIVFVPVVFVSGAAKYLFTPLAMAVVFAMLASYFLSRTVVPNMAHYLLAAEAEMYQQGEHASAPKVDRNYKVLPRTLGVCLAIAFVVGLAPTIFHLVTPHDPSGKLTLHFSKSLSYALVDTVSWLDQHALDILIIALIACVGIIGLRAVGKYNVIWNVHDRFNRVFEKFLAMYAGGLAWALAHRRAVSIVFLAFVGLSAALVFPRIGQDFFPAVDAGQFRLHVRGPAGTRIEETEQLFADVTKSIRESIPANEVSIILDNIGVPGGVNLAYTDSATISSADGEILVALNAENHGPTEKYIGALRTKLRDRFPQVTFFFQPADIVTQILNFGLAAPIDIQVQGRSPDNLRIANEIRKRVAEIPGAVDVHLQQVPTAPALAVDVDRTLARQIGLSQRDVAQSLLISLSGSSQTAPNQWLDPKNNVQYSVAVQTPQFRMDSVDDLSNTPIVAPGAPPQLLTNLATISPSDAPAVVNHYNINPVLDVQASVAHSDLGSVAKAIDKIIEEYRGDPRDKEKPSKLPRGSFINVKGQIDSMRNSYSGLGFGLIFAVVLVYALMVVNFQSWLDPLIILMALPGAMCGIIWMLFATQTNLSVPALMGSIMCIGVATSNSILLITFANDQRKEGMNALEAALTAGRVRLRPVLMTALAMILGMLPMSLGLGEGGEQNAPLGRAVIGGLTVATFATLFFVPVVYSVMRRQEPNDEVEPELAE